MKKWIMIIDIAKCENCNNCFLSCKDEHCGNDWPGYAVSQPLHGQRWMNILRKERGQFPRIDVAYLPKPCLHCDDAPCVQKAGGAIRKRPDGIVIIDPEAARGREDLRAACPYGAIWWDAEVQVPQKCTFCAHLLDDGWRAPRCVQACPTGALSARWVEISEIPALMAAEDLEALEADGTGATFGVYYRNLYRYRSCFISGSVAVEKNGTADCVEEANVILYKGGAEIARTRTDVFGDFKFDGLPADSGRYHLDVAWRDEKARRIEVDVTDSRTLETVWL